MSHRISARAVRPPWRFVLGAALLLHALAHAGAGVWASQPRGAWGVAVLWCVATAGYLLSASWLLAVVPGQETWRAASVVASIASIGLIALVQNPVVLPGAIVSLGVLFIAARAPLVEELRPQHGRAARFGGVVLLFFGAYASVAILLRPWHTRWGSTDSEFAAPLPGDNLEPDARYRVEHAITINAPADSVWPWLLQMGQDRAGFYSYGQLERAVGADIRNVNRIVPEWQSLAVGDLVRMVPPDWMGGRFGNSIGVRVAEIVPGRALVLDGWGAFVLIPVTDSATRLIVRTRGDGTPTLRDTPIAPLGAFVFEPAHFMMQRRMLLTIKRNAEGRREG